MMQRLADLIRAEAPVGEAVGDVAAEFEVSVSTVKAAWRLVRDLPPPDWLAALVKRHRGSTPAAINPDMLAWFFRDYGRQERPSSQAAWERTRVKAARRGWGPVPCVRTFMRHWGRVHPDTRTLLREGERALEARLPHLSRDRSGMRPLDSVNMDSRVWDVLVALPDGRVTRPTVTVIQDEATNFLLAYEVTETETGASYRRVMCEAFTRYGIPDLVRFDNTRAAANKATTAGAKGRHRFTDRADDVPGLLPRLGVRVSFTLPRNGRAKLVERLYAELKERSEKHPDLAGAYTGRSPSEKPANYGTRPAPLATFERVLGEAVHHYNTRTDRRSAVAYRTSHAAVFEAGLATRPVRTLTAAQRALFFLRAERVTLSPAGDVLLGPAPHRHRYHAEALAAHAGREVVARFDENDFAAPIVVETLDGTLIAATVPRLEAGSFASAEAAGIYHRERRARQKRAKEDARSMLRMDEAQRGTVVAPTPRTPTPIAPARIVEPRFGAPSPAVARGSRRAAAACPEGEAASADPIPTRARSRAAPNSRPASRGFSASDFERMARGAELRRAAGDG